MIDLNIAGVVFMLMLVSICLSAIVTVLREIRDILKAKK